MKGFVIVLLLFPTNERFCDFVTFVPYSIGTKVTNVPYSIGTKVTSLELDWACDMTHVVLE